MAITFGWAEDNGAAAGSPATGTTRTYFRGDCNWKNADSSTNDYTSYPITTGNNSYRKYQFGVFTGTANLIQNVKFGHTTGILGAGITLMYTGTSGYATPVTTALAAPAVNMTLSSGLAASYQSPLLSQHGPQRASGTTMAGTGYTSYLVTQILTTTAATAGTQTATLSISFDES